MKTVVVGKYWGADGETAFVLRSLAGAAARVGEVAVVAPDWPARSTPDGLFDVRGVTSGSDLRRAADLTPDSVVIVDALGPDIVEGLRSTPFRAGFYLTTTEETVEPPWAGLSLVPDPGLPDGSPPAGPPTPGAESSTYESARADPEAWRV